MISKELGAISKLRENFNSIPRDNLIKGMRTRNEFLESLKQKENVNDEKEELNDLDR